MREDGRRVARGTRAAEWLLSATTAPRRAAAIVGDLSEQASGRSTFWFWQATLRIALACLWQSLFSPATVKTGMTRGSDDFLVALWRHKWLLVACVLLSVTVTSIALSFYPARYRSQTVILLVPKRVPDEYVPTPGTSDISQRLSSIEQQVLSGTRLERLITELDLYRDARQHAAMELAVQQMRRDVTVERAGAGALRIGFDGVEPRTVMKVAERLAMLFMDANRLDRTKLVTATFAFIESQLDDTRLRLDEQEAVLASSARAGRTPSKADTIEYEVLQQEYRDLLTKRRAAQMAANLESRQIGEQFRILEQARLPTEPMPTNHAAVNTGGAFAGLGLGVALIGVSSRRRPRVGEQPPDEG